MKAIVFDLDDTLYPEREYAFSGFRAVAAAFEPQLGNPIANASTLEQLFDSEHRRKVFDALLSHLGRPHDSDLVAQMVAVFRNHLPSIRLHSDAERCVRKWFGRIPLGLITDGPVAAQSAKIRALGIADRIEAVILTEELGVGFGKPHRRAFELISRKLRCPSSDCVYVGDNALKDFVAPNAMGWTTIQIQRPDGVYHDAVAPPGGAPQYQIETMDALDPINPEFAGWAS